MGSFKPGESITGLEYDYCKSHCGRVLVKEETNEEGYLVPVESPYYKWRPCTQGCRINECSNCIGSNYKDPNDINGDGISDIVQSVKKDTPIEIKVRGNIGKKLNKKDTCYGKSFRQCDQDTNCVYCNSQMEDEKEVCFRHGDKLICDKKYVNACMPIRRVGAKFEAYNTGPYHDFTPYQRDLEKVKINGKMENVLYYPTQCKEPIKPQVGIEERNRIIRKNFR